MSAFATTTARLLFATLTLSALGLHAQPQVSQLADLNTGQNQFTRSSMIVEGAVRFDGRMLFSATTDRTGRELWVSDGTPQSTRLLVDLCPGRCDGLPLNPQFTVIDGDLYFSASNGVHGFELWRWRNGQDAPRMLVDLNEGAPSSSPRLLASRSLLIGGVPVVRHYLAATHVDVGRELWRLVISTSPSIVLERDIAPSTASSNPSSVEILGRLASEPGTDRVGVLALNPERVRKLFVLGYSTATAPPSSIQVFDPFITGQGRGLVGELVKVGGNTFVEVDDDNNNREELWAISGPSSAVQLRTANSLAQLTAQPGLNRLFFAERAVAGGPTLLMVTDGTSAGTRSVGSATSPLALTAVSTRLLYTTVTPAEGLQLHRSDGTPAGTAPVRTLINSTPGGLRFSATASRTRMLLGFDDQLWISDGTISGTQNISGSIGAGGTGQFDGILPLEGLEAIIAWSPGPGSNAEPYFTRGSAASTVSLGNLASDSGDSDVKPLAVLNGKLLLSAYRGIGDSAATYALDLGTTGALDTLPFRADLSLGGHFDEQWLYASGRLAQTDGTPGGSTVASSFNIGSFAPECIVERGGLRYFVASTASSIDLEIWRSDGSDAGTVPVTDFSTAGNFNAQGISDCRQNGNTNIVRFGPNLLLEASNASVGAELFRLDGNDQASLVTDLRAGPLGAFPFPFVPLPDRVLFTADDGVFGRELWTSDGTAQGTQRLTDINPGTGDGLELNSIHGPIIRAGSMAYFVGVNQASGRELYRTDGTPSGTSRISDFNTGSGSTFAGNFSGSGGASSEAGPRVAVALGDDLVVGFSPSFASTCVLLQTLDRGTGFRCAYDGEAARFGPVRELVAMPSGVIVFSAARLDLEQGEEIHALRNGQLLNLAGGDIAPGPQSSAPRHLLVDGNTVYFQADDGSTGRELWQLDLSEIESIFRDGFESP